MFHLNEIQSVNCQRTNPVKLNKGFRRHTLGALVAICSLAVTTGCVTVAEDDDGGGSNGGGTIGGGTNGGGNGIADGNGNGNGNGNSTGATCSSVCENLLPCDLTQEATMVECVAECLQLPVTQSELDCLATASCASVETCIGGSPGGGTGSGQGSECSTSEDCPWHACDCPDGSTPQSRGCVNGTCLDAELACSNACS